MADGYARASNGPGVMLAGQNGPGATNLITGIAQAKAAFSPVVSIADHFLQKIKWKMLFKGLINNLFKPIIKKTWLVKNVKKIPETFSDAFKLAMSSRKGLYVLIFQEIYYLKNQNLRLMKIKSPIKNKV